MTDHPLRYTADPPTYHVVTHGAFLVPLQCDQKNESVAQFHSAE